MGFGKLKVLSTGAAEKPQFKCLTSKTEAKESVLEDELYVFRRNQIENDRLEALQQGRQFNLPLFKYDQIPSFLQDNKFILTGYRAYYSISETWESVFMLHNETGSIWTHLIAALYFVYLLFDTVVFPIKTADMESVKIADLFVLCSYLVSSISCFSLSTLFHTHHCHSKETYHRLGCLDAAGISALICASCCAVTYFGYYCEPKVRFGWLILTILLSGITIVGPFTQVWARRSFRKIRVVLYLVTSIAGALPILLYVWSSGGIPAGINRDICYSFASMAFLYIGGAFVFSCRWPESWWPGKFDYYLHSHQIWHCAVAAACYAHYWTVFELFRWRVTEGQCSLTA